MVSAGFNAPLINTQVLSGALVTMHKYVVLSKLQH